MPRPGAAGLRGRLSEHRVGEVEVAVDADEIQVLLPRLTQLVCHSPDRASASEVKYTASVKRPLSCQIRSAPSTSGRTCWSLGFHCSSNDASVARSSTVPSITWTKTDRTARVVIAGYAFMQNMRRGHYELSVEADPRLRVRAAFTELTETI
jgi:hypothetical protein